MEAGAEDGDGAAAAVEGGVVHKLIVEGDVDGVPLVDDATAFRVADVVGPRVFDSPTDCRQFSLSAGERESLDSDASATQRTYFVSNPESGVGFTQCITGLAGGRTAAAGPRN